MKINREEWIQSLEAVQYGLAPREIQEQSTCFIFKSGIVYTYNGEVFCQAKSRLNKSFTGAVRAMSLLDTIRKLPDEEVDIIQTDSEIIIKGKGREFGVRMEKEILLSVDDVEKPKEWKTLHEDFCDAIAIVKDCAGKDQNQFSLTCIHIHPKWVEACDRCQLARYRLPTGVSEKVLVRKESIKNIVALGMTEFSETSCWMHFRNPSGIILSCRRFLDEYINLSPYLEVNGARTVLPKGLKEAVERAEIFSKENSDYNLVSIELKDNKLKLKGQGASGWYAERKKVRYEGKPVSFLIGPKILGEVAQKYNDCVVSEDKLKVDGGKWKYVTSLSKVAENGHESNGESAS